jgi:curved DNA-binding protein
MSAHFQVEFKDYYGILGVDYKSTSEVIASTYQGLARRFHPNTPKTGNKAKYEEVTAAYEVLADPQSRADFDKLRGGREEEKPRFSGPRFFDHLKAETARRSAILCVLYDRRRQKPFTPSVSMRHLEGLMSLTAEELNFCLWFLKQRALVQSDDRSSLLITVDGMDWLEKNMPDFAAVRQFVREFAEDSAPPQAK